MTQKPSDFTMNSDYLSIAQTGKHEYNVYVGGGTLQVGGYTEQNFDFTIPANKGAIDRILIGKDSGNYRLGCYMELFPNNDATVAGFLHVFRTSPTNLRAQLMLENHTGSATSYPSMSFTIKVASFKPPNVF